MKIGKNRYRFGLGFLEPLAAPEDISPFNTSKPTGYFNGFVRVKVTDKGEVKFVKVEKDELLQNSLCFSDRSF